MLIFNLTNCSNSTGLIPRQVSMRELKHNSQGLPHIAA